MAEGANRKPTSPRKANRVPIVSAFSSREALVASALCRSVERSLGHCLLLSYHHYHQFPLPFNPRLLLEEFRLIIESPEFFIIRYTR